MTRGAHAPPLGYALGMTVDHPKATSNAVSNTVMSTVWRVCRNVKTLEGDLHCINSNLKSLEFSENKVRPALAHINTDSRNVQSSFIIILTLSKLL